MLMCVLWLLSTYNTEPLVLQNTSFYNDLETVCDNCQQCDMTRRQLAMTVTKGQSLVGPTSQTNQDSWKHLHDQFKITSCVLPLKLLMWQISFSWIVCLCHGNGSAVDKKYVYTTIRREVHLVQVLSPLWPILDSQLHRWQVTETSTSLNFNPWLLQVFYFSLSLWQTTVALTTAPILPHTHPLYPSN